MADSGGNIHCTVNNCHYWSDGNLCRASEILVTSNTMSKNLPETIDVPYASQITQTPVNENKESCCKTFVKKNDFNQNVDGVLKTSSRTI